MATAALLSGQYDDGLTTFYQVDPDVTPTHIQYDGIERVGVRLDSGASAIGSPIKSVWLRFRKYGLPTGPITVNVRKATDDSAVLIGIFNIEHFPADTEQSLVIRNRQGNTYNCVVNDIVSVEFPSNAVNGFEITTHSTAGNPTNYSGVSFNGSSWSTTSDPPCLGYFRPNFSYSATPSGDLKNENDLEYGSSPPRSCASNAFLSFFDNVLLDVDTLSI